MNDRVTLGSSFTSFSQVLASSFQVGADLEIRLNSTDVLVIQNFYIGNLSADDVHIGTF